MIQQENKHMHFFSILFLSDGNNNVQDLILSTPMCFNRTCVSLQTTEL